MPRFASYIFLYFFILITAFANASSNKKSAIVIDFNNNQKIIFADNATAPRHPASLTKIMTIYMLFDAIQKRKISLNTKFKVSRLASIQAPSKLGLKVGEKISVLDIIKALTVKSANDAAVVAAEGLCGSTDAFCSLMNRKAKSLGMTKTNFENPSGLPNKKQITTAKDMALLLISIYRKFPQYWNLFSLKSFVYNKAIHGTHCKILHWYKGSDGAKTGYIAASGFNLAVTAAKYNKSGASKRLFVVVMGRESGKIRDLYAAKLMNQYFGEYSICSQKPVQKVLSKEEQLVPTKQRQALLKHISKAEILEPVVYEEEEIKIDDILATESVDKKYIDNLYEVDEDIIQIEDEIFIKPTTIKKISKKDNLTTKKQSTKNNRKISKKKKKTAGKSYKN